LLQSDKDDIMLVADKCWSHLPADTINLMLAGDSKGHYTPSALPLPPITGGITMFYYVYGLVDPRDNLPHYIGITTQPKFRYWSHRANKEVYNKAKIEWLAELRRLGLRPILFIYGKFESKQVAAETETNLIQDGFTKYNWPLTNRQVYSNRNIGEIDVAKTRAILSKVFDKVMLP
jgi:hypothetical protein